MSKLIYDLRKHKIKVIAGVVILVLAFLFLNPKESTDIVSTEAPLPLVTMTTAAELSGEELLSVIGTARAFTEAVITSEGSGRVTTVSANLGQTVPAGFVIATLENASERAAVLQAEGVYEGAVASAAQTNISQDEAQTTLLNAQNNAIATIRTAYSTVDSVIRNSVDQFFSDPDSPFTPGLRINGQGFTSELNERRVVLTSALPAWENRTETLTVNSDFPEELAYARKEVERAIEIVSTFITVFNEQESYSRYTEEQVTAFATNFGTIRNNLISLLSQLDTAETRLVSAKDVVRRASLAGTGGTTSAADAQIKQALGSLRSAQAALSKTILQTPISGTVNALNVRVGDFVGNQEIVARVANNNALEVVTFLGDKDLATLQIGSPVTIEDDYIGTVSAIAPAVDTLTKKTEVRIALDTSDIKNGDTVTITKNITPETVEDSPIFIPLSAVKFEIDKSFVFQVNDGQLVTIPVETGVVRGGSVEILNGLSMTESFVLDVRGLVAGTKVDVNTQ